MKEISRTVLFLASICLILGCGGREKRPAEAVVARVDDDILTASEMFSKVPPEFSRFVTFDQWLQVAGDWTDQRLLVRCAIDNGAMNNPDVVRRIAAVQEQILIDYLQSDIVSQRIEVANEDMEAYYLSHQGDFVRDWAEANALHILVQGKEAADTVKKLLGANVPFCEVARMFSVEFSNTDSCNLGWFSKSDILPELSHAVFMAKPGEILGPIKIDDEYHFLMIVDSQKAGTLRSIEQVRNEIEQKVFAARFTEALNEILDSLRASAHVFIDTAAIDSIAAAK